MRLFSFLAILSAALSAGSAPACCFFKCFGKSAPAFLAVAGFLVGRGGEPATIPEDTLAPTSAGAASIALVTAARPPDASVVFTTLVNGSR